MPTVHNEAKDGEIAKIVLMPGDPMRAKYIAEKFLENAVCFNRVRGMLGYTGYYKGKRVSVMASGMGMPSMGIYSYELYKFFDVDKIIRIGSCGAYTDKLELLDVFLVEQAYSEGNFALTFRDSKEHISFASKELNNKIEKMAQKNNVNLKKGCALTSECFDPYIDIDKLKKRIPANLNCQVAEMEAYALFNVASKLNKEAACILSVSDSLAKGSKVSSQEREKSLDEMITLALDVSAEC